MNRRVSRLPKEARALLSPYFPGFNLTRVRVREGIPWYVVGRPRGYADRYSIYLAHGDFRIDSVEGISLLAHEIAHCRQYQELGVWKFRALYLRHYFANLVRGMAPEDAYLNIPFEIEARTIERRVLVEVGRLGEEAGERLKRLLL